MKILGAAKRIFDRIIYWCTVLSTIFIVVIMFTNMLDTVARLLKIPLYGVYELNSIMVGMAIFLGMALIQQKKKHISVTILTNVLPVKINQVIAMLLYTLGVVFFGWLSYWYGAKAYHSFIVNEVIRGIVKYPAFPLKFTMFFGLLLLTIQQIIDLASEVVQFLSKPPEEPAGKRQRIETEVSGL